MWLHLFLKFCRTKINPEMNFSFLFSLNTVGEYSDMSNAVAALARSASEMMAQRETERQASLTSSEVSSI